MFVAGPRRVGKTTLARGGLQELFVGGSEAEACRWSREHRTVFLRHEIASLERILDLGKLEALMLAIPDRVRSPLSLDALRGEIEVAPKTLAHWVAVLERLYAVFRIRPFGPLRLRALKKMPKHDHLDWTVVRTESARFENLVACHLLKWVHCEQDTEGHDLDLIYCFRSSPQGLRHRGSHPRRAAPALEFLRQPM